MKIRYDCVVIGSGFGGAVTACRLAQAGRSVAVLERGRRWGKEDFPRTVGQVARSFWDERETYGMLGYKAFKNVDVIQGVGVGGGSLHYFNVGLRAPQEILEQPAWPASVTRSTLDPYYELAEYMLGSQPLDPPDGRELPARTQVFREAAAATGRDPKLVNIAVYTGSERQNPHGGATQDACVYCGNCMLGCHVHAKNTLDITYLGLAERRHGVEVFPLHTAESIEPLEGQGYRVQFRRLDPDHPGQSEPGSVTGQQVIVAAGTLGSAELLLKSRDVLGTLPSLSPALGQRFSTNGDFLLAGAFETAKRIDPGHGPSITAAVDCSTQNNRITIEDLGFPDPMLWYLEGIARPFTVRAGQLARLAFNYLLQSVGLRGPRSQVSEEIDALFTGGTTPHFLPFLGMGTDAADGSLRLKGGTVDIRWSHKKSRRMFREMEDAMREISRAAGGRYKTSLLWRWPARKLLTAHPLGGCAVGDDQAKSVANDRGEVWGYPGLYVCDGSVIPTALAVNPSLTIAALAERTAYHMIYGKEMTAEDADRLAAA